MARTLAQLLVYIPMELFMMILNACLDFFPAAAAASAALFELFKLVDCLPPRLAMRKRFLAAFYQKTSFIIDKNNVDSFEKAFRVFIQGVEKVTFDLRLYMCPPTSCWQPEDENCVCKRLRAMISSPFPSIKLQHFASLKNVTIELLNIRADYDLVSPLIRHLVTASSQLERVSLMLQIVESARIGTLRILRGAPHCLETDELYQMMNRLFKGKIKGEKKPFFGFRKNLNHTTFSGLYHPSDEKHQYEAADEVWTWKVAPGRVLELWEEGDEKFEYDEDMYSTVDEDEEEEYLKSR